MFYLIGTGLKPEQVTAEAIAALKKCGKVYIETYTSGFSEGLLKAFVELVGKEPEELERKDIEEGFNEKILEAREKDVALLVIGNPLFATTHVQLLLDAEEAGVEWTVIPGISVHGYLGRTGLNAYRFGRTVSIVMPSKNYKPESFYDGILANLEAGLHTLCLLDIKPGRKMAPGEALRLLLGIEKKRGGKTIRNAGVVVLAGLGSKEEKIASGSAEKLSEIGFPLPASIIVCAKLSEKEEEALAKLTEAVG